MIPQFMKMINWIDRVCKNDNWYIYDVVKDQEIIKDYWPSVKQIAGSVVSSKPEQMAFRTAPLSNLPTR